MKNTRNTKGGHRKGVFESRVQDASTTLPNLSLRACENLSIPPSGKAPPPQKFQFIEQVPDASVSEAAQLFHLFLSAEFSI
jgi:hypothetical protein